MRKLMTGMAAAVILGAGLVGVGAPAYAAGGTTSTTLPPRTSTPTAKKQPVCIGGWVWASTGARTVLVCRKWG